MKSFVKTITLAASFLICASSFAQTPASAVNAATVKASAAASSAATSAGSTATNAASSATTATKAKVAAAGGAADKVWLNTKSNVYHCFGTKSYGTTKVGEYMSEADAKAKGGHADHGKACKAS
ncbi:hypothetical protein [Solimicrobium silvestre]|uniref:ALANIN-rich signal peptide protein n=1 Tax=Solimicrobium silvestre TaxID=2099400 RepID=A0A2S9GV60_9BURK|nr:hypothetical protein [Solimicrobium silvestre]PRC91615.1 hypothetical protein S2091_3731 [Solimicrobium silvestre]